MYARKYVFEHPGEIAEVHRRVGEDQELRERQLPFTQNTKARNQSLARITLAYYCCSQRMKSRFTITPQMTHTRHHQWKQRREERLQIITEEEVLLPGLAHNCRGIDCITTMKDRFAMKDRVVMS